MVILAGCSSVRADDDWPDSVKLLKRTSILAPTVPAFELSAEPMSRGAKKNLEVLERIRTKLKTTRYQHRTVVKERVGKYLWDCSGMTQWILKRSAPRALKAIKRKRMVARDFYKVIKRSPTSGYRKGWKQVAHIKDVRPGDIFAWLRPPDWPRRNTGHVGFVLAPPVPVPEIPDAYAVRIADATSVPHQKDTRASMEEGGYGEGTILWTTDGDGKGLAYGWHGTRSRAVVTTSPVFGRVR